MRHPQTNKDLEHPIGFTPDIGLEGEFSLNDEEYGFEPGDFDIPHHFGPHREMSVSSQTRRAIEEHFERKKLHKELDYLFDEEFEQRAKQESSEE